MEVALYLLPVTLGDTAIEKVLPSYNREIIVNIKHFIVEDVRSARRFLKRWMRIFVLMSLLLSVEQAYFSGSYIGFILLRLQEGHSMGVISGGWFVPGFVAGSGEPMW